MLKIVLIHPEIPGNTGTIGRTTVALELELILIRPYGFEISEKAVRRAGLDYWKHVRLREFDSFEQFLEADADTVTREKLFFFSRFASSTYFSARYPKDAVLIFGAETKGIPKDILEKYPDRCVQIPTFSPKIRSLNLANAATAAIYEAVRQNYFS